MSKLTELTAKQRERINKNMTQQIEQVQREFKLKLVSGEYDEAILDGKSLVLAVEARPDEFLNLDG